METKSTSVGVAYPPPLDRLLELGRLFTRGRAWRDYLEMGIGREHMPDLLRLACDMELNHGDQDDPRVYGPLHAWRALGQLAPTEAVAPLVDLLVQLPDDDFANEDLPVVLGMIGAAAVEPVAAILADSDIEERTRISAASALEEIGKRHPELRDRCVEVLTRQLERWAEQPDGLNGFLIHDLIELGAVEVAPQMEAAYAGGGVDLMIRGDWQDVQVDLGLLAERTTPREPLNVLERLRLTSPPKSSVPVPAGAAARARRKEDKRRKAKRKRR
jgi:hypothetical protein